MQNRWANKIAGHEPPKVAFQLTIPEPILRAELSSARIYVDGVFVGNYAEGLVFQLPGGIHRIAVEVPRADEVRRKSNGTIAVRNFKLSGQESIKVFGGASFQSISFDLSNLKRTEIDIDDPD